MYGMKELSSALSLRIGSNTQQDVLVDRLMLYHVFGLMRGKGENAYLVNVLFVAIQVVICIKLKK